MLRNVVEIEHEAMRACLLEEDAVIILLHFTAAFPSVSRSYLMASAVAAGLPGVAMGVLESLYHNTIGVLTIHG